MSKADTQIEERHRAIAMCQYDEKTLNYNNHYDKHGELVEPNTVARIKQCYTTRTRGMWGRGGQK